MSKSLQGVAIRVNTACSGYPATLRSMDRETLLRKRQGKRLAEARKSAGFRSARQAALESGWPESSYRAHEGGTRTIGQDDAERYARQFRNLGSRITARDILFDTNSERGAPGTPSQDPVTLRVPYLSMVAASKMTDMAEVPELKDAPTIPVSDLPRGDWFALRVEGDSMDRVAPDSSIILVNAADRRLVSKKFYVFAHRGMATFKQYVDKPKLLLPYSTNPVHVPIVPEKSFTVIGRVYRALIDL